MKRAGNLYDKIYELKNIHTAYYKASKGKKNKRDVIRFSENMEVNLNEIQKQLINRNVTIGNYHYFKITDPKERTICAASFPERVIHHAIMNITEEIFENCLIDDSYACRKNKGMHKSVNKAFKSCRKYQYYLKLDIKKYFDSIDHTILMNLLKRKIKDRDLLDLFRKIIDSYHTKDNKGIPIGNLTSQYFANFYLSFFDRYIKEELRQKNYYRYMDDFVLFFKNKEELYNLLSKIRKYLEINLDLKLKPPIINKVDKGVTFLGCRIYKNKILLSKRSKNRFKDKFIKYENKYLRGYWNIDTLSAHINSLIAFTDMANARDLRNMIIKKYGVISL